MIATTTTIDKQDQYATLRKISAAAVQDRLSQLAPSNIDAGRERGREWAEHEASFRELRTLARDANYLLTCVYPELLPHALFETITGDCPDECCCDCYFGWMQELFDDIVTEAANDPDTIRGFVEGAVSVWQATRDVE